MANVACFCGCLFSFEGGAGACPTCGEVASLLPAAAPALGQASRLEPAVLLMNWGGQDRQAPGAVPDLIDVEVEVEVRTVPA